MKHCILIISMTLSMLAAAAQADMSALVHNNLKVAMKQYEYLKQKVPYDSMPRTFQDGKNLNSNLAWWCSGFYPGTLLYLYEYSKDSSILNEARKRLAALEVEKHDTRDHDLGFKMFCSFGNAYRLTGDPHFKEVIITSAASLVSRYRPSIQSIQSWDKNSRFNCPVIIDNMMNLEMLLWAAHNGGNSDFRTVALNHANTTLKNHFRPDYSSYHVLDYDLTTGRLQQKVTAQGAADSSAWSRGQSWALYGFTMMYRFTKDKRYLAQANGIAKFILQNPHLPADKVPYWDFDAPGIPNVPKDASAAAVTASALLELAQYSNKKEYVATARTILQTLSSDAYLASPGENGGFLLKHSVGSIPHKVEVDVPLTYADYYFIEALLRYKKWYL